MGQTLEEIKPNTSVVHNAAQRSSDNFSS